jgi:hypothetical protein
MAKEFMTTAKELAYKAYCFKNPLPADWNESDRAQHFESWWSENYNNVDGTRFYNKHNVYLDGKRFIQAE